MFEQKSNTELASLSEKPDTLGMAISSEPVSLSAYDPKKAPSDINWVHLLIRVRDARDQAAFADLFQYYAPRVKAFLMKSGAEPELAEECAQETMVAVWHKAHMFDPSRASVATWIFTIARNKRIDAYRRVKRPEPEDLPWGNTEEPDAAETYELHQESKRLAQAVEALPEKQREIVKQAFYGDLSHQELAHVTGLPLGTIKSRIRLALERLRHTMK